MSLNSILKIFQPKDKIFFNLFESVGTHLMQMSAIFYKATYEINHDNGTKKSASEIQEMRDDLLKKLEDLEHKNDEVTHEIFIQLGRNFITPLDREDIHYLATSLDDIADYIWGAAKRIINYQVEDDDKTIESFAKIIKESVNAVNAAIFALRDRKDLKLISETCIAINSLENQADDLLDASLINLFETKNINHIDFFKKKDIFQMLEIVTDKCEDASNVIESIIIKYA
ncbi:MAG: DUF47 family protein [Chitinophagia bacterium]|nr:DUF47 family protein [Chitinophagia bacterium]